MAGCTFTDLNQKGKFTFQGAHVRKSCDSYVLGTRVGIDVDVEVYEFLYEGPPLAFNYNGIRQYIVDGSVYSMAKDFFWRNTPHSKFQWPTYKVTPEPELPEPQSGVFATREVPNPLAFKYSYENDSELKHQPIMYDHEKP